MKKYFLSLLILILAFEINAQSDRWQQWVEYKMNVELDVQTNQLRGEQNLKYYNYSPDTLNKVFFHLYYNAFQPGSMMDVRSRTLPDPDKRVTDRIYQLKQNEIGEQKIKSLNQNGKKLQYVIEGTIMTVLLSEPLLPHSNTVFNIQFESQVPLQIRRTGRDNQEGIRYSMAQWFPKIAEYDVNGWHAYEYIGREFYSPWGDYDVKITIDSGYTVAAGGVLQNPDEIGKGYSSYKPTSPKLTYHFKADNVHDFVWAADPDFVHQIIPVRPNLDFHYFYQKDTLEENWHQLPAYITKALPFVEKNFGAYTYPVYNVIQGGDGGMEYPMATLITGHRSMSSLLKTTMHELIHSWFQMTLATDEMYFYWMDEGFTTYAENLALEFIENKSSINPLDRIYSAYINMVKNGDEEPLTTSADHFRSSKTYTISAYYKGAIWLRQLEYILGKENFQKGMLTYYHQWKFKHPTPQDFLRVMERQSDMELDWYFDYWVTSTKSIDYSIRNVYSKGNKTNIQLERIGEMPMPIDIKVTLKSGKDIWYNIALPMMRGQKPLANDQISLTNWPWVNPYYSFEIKESLDSILKIEIDPKGYMSDTDLTNNSYPLKSATLEIIGVPK